MTPDARYQGSWTSPAASRLLLEAGAGAMIAGFPGFLNPGVEPHHISILEQSTGIRYNAKNTYNNGKGNQYNPRFSQRFGASYVTGGDVNYAFRNAVPVSITQYATPYLTRNRTRADMGIYAQDQRVINRLTLNYGGQWLKPQFILEGRIVQFSGDISF